MPDLNLGTITLPEQYLTDEDTNWGIALQQMVTKVGNLGEIKTGITGDSYKYTEEGATEMERSAVYSSTTTGSWEDKGRFEDITLDDLKSDSTFMLKADFHKHLGVEYTDADLSGVQSLISNRSKSILAASQRQLEQSILGVDVDTTSSSDTYGKPIIKTTGLNYLQGGIFGIRKSGIKIGTATSKTLSASSIASTLGGSSTTVACGMNIDKFLAMLEELEDQNLIGDCGLGEKSSLRLLVTPEMVYQLIAEEDRLGSSEYGFSALKDGSIANIAGVEFVKTNYLPFVKESSVYVRRAVMYNPSRLLIGHWKDMHLEIKDQPQKVKTCSVGGYCSFGAARKDDTTFVTVDCLTKRATVSST